MIWPDLASFGSCLAMEVQLDRIASSTEDPTNWTMKGDTNWSDDEFDHNRSDNGVPQPCLDPFNKDEGNSKFESITSVLPGDLQERILASLPIACILTVRSVCKKWNEIVSTKRFMTNVSSSFADKPWYFMFTCYDEPSGHVYDPVFRTWHAFELPYFRESSWYFASSRGLTCIMDDDNKIELCVCNPLTRESKKIEEPLGLKFLDYNALAFSVDNYSSYKIAVVRSKQVFHDIRRWDISIHIYCSETMTWLSPVTETLSGWRGGDVSVICDGVLYLMVHYAGLMNSTRNLHGVLAYKLCRQSSDDEKLINTLIEAPCFLTCGRLMNMKGKLVMVGGIGRRDRPGIIKGISIWILDGRKWELVSRMPRKFFQGSGEIDDVFTSSGSGCLIYIQSFGATTPFVFNMNLKEWSWAQRCPRAKKNTLQIFTGFCFEPRLESLP